MLLSTQQQKHSLEQLSEHDPKTKPGPTHTSLCIECMFIKKKEKRK
jgi:hypothetical protein